MSRVTKKVWYQRVNGAWPSSVPPLTEGEAVRAARRLYRFVFKKTFKGKIQVTSGNRRNLVYNVHYYQKMKVNPTSGWHVLVHDLSHGFALGLPHGGEHARLERRMINQVVRRGWLDGKLKDKSKPAKLPVDPKVKRYENVCARLKRWESRAKRAQTAIKKLSRTKKRLEKKTNEQVEHYASDMTGSDMFEGEPRESWRDENGWARKGRHE